MLDACFQHLYPRSIYQLQISRRFGVVNHDTLVVELHLTGMTADLH